MEITVPYKLLLGSVDFCVLPFFFPFFFLFFLEILKLGFKKNKSTSMAKFLQESHFISRFSVQWAYSTQQAAQLTGVSVFIVVRNTVMGFHDLSDGLKHSS